MNLMLKALIEKATSRTMVILDPTAGDDVMIRDIRDNSFIFACEHSLRQLNQLRYSSHSYDYFLLTSQQIVQGLG